MADGEYPLPGGASPLALAGDLLSPGAHACNLQCGIDLVEIERIVAAIDRFGVRFLDRIWTERELAYCRGRAPELAARFAGKEATSKALGTGITGLVWRDVEILPDERGKPLIFLHGGAKERAAQIGLSHWAISLTHSRHMACAMVVACAER